MHEKGAREFVLGKSGLFGKNTKNNLAEINNLLNNLNSSS